MTGKIDIVLDGERHAEEPLALGAAPRHCLGHAENLVARQQVDPDLVVAARRDPVEKTGHEVDGFEGAGAIAGLECRKIETVGWVEHRYLA